MNKRAVVWMAVCTTRLSRHSAVFNYTLISSHHRERGFESIWRQEGGSLFTLVVVFSLFVVVQSWFKGFVSGDKRGSGTDWGPPHPVCLCKHTYRHYTEKHILLLLHTFYPQKVYCWDFMCASLPPFPRDPLWTKGSVSVSAWDVVPRQSSSWLYSE